MVGHLLHLPRDALVLSRVAIVLTYDVAVPARHAEPATVVHVHVLEELAGGHVLENLHVLEDGSSRLVFASGNRVHDRVDLCTAN